MLGVGNMIKQLGASKLLFSSDNIYNIPVEIAKYKSFIKKEEDLEKVFFKNAIDVFSLDV